LVDARGAQCGHDRPAEHHAEEQSLESAADALIVPASGLVPGYECGRCGTLSLAPDSCPDWGTAPLRVPDVIEEMVARVLPDGGDVSVTHDASAPVAARLRQQCPAVRTESATDAR
jgi:hypothetical protein